MRFTFGALLAQLYLTGTLSLGIFVGFASFFIMEKTLRVLGGDDDHAHGHSHSHSVAPQAHSSGVSVDSHSSSGLKSRKSEKDPASDSSESNGDTPAKSGAQPSKLSAYLNLFGDFVHNM